MSVTQFFNTFDCDHCLQTVRASMHTVPYQVIIVAVARPSVPSSNAPALHAIRSLPQKHPHQMIWCVFVTGFVGYFFVLGRKTNPARTALTIAHPIASTEAVMLVHPLFSLVANTGRKYNAQPCHMIFLAFHAGHPVDSPQRPRPRGALLRGQPSELTRVMPPFHCRDHTKLPLGILFLAEMQIFDLVCGAQAPLVG